MSIDMAHVRHAPGQAVRECPGCGQALVDTGDGVWAHAIGTDVKIVSECLGRAT